MFTVACFPPESPKASTHETPAAVCAAVGGQGYFAASVAGLTPALSVAGQEVTRSVGHGGPGVGETILYCPENVPVGLVVISPATEIPVQLTGSVSLFPMMDKATVGSFEALLHSRIAPEALESKPDPVTVTTDPPFKHVPGSTVRLVPSPMRRSSGRYRALSWSCLGSSSWSCSTSSSWSCSTSSCSWLVLLPPVIVAVSIVSGLALVHENPGSAVPFRFRVTV